MFDRTSPDALISDGYWRAEIVTSLAGRGILTWRDLSAHDFNTVASWGRDCRWALEMFKDELVARGLPFPAFDAWELLATKTKNALCAAGIKSLASLQRMKRSELATLKGLGSRGIGNIEDCCRLAGIILRPESSGEAPLPDLLLVIEEDRLADIPTRVTAERLGVAQSRVSVLRRKVDAAKRQRAWARSDTELWEKQQELFDTVAN